MSGWFPAGWFWANALGTLLLPPASPLIAICVAIMVLPRRPNLAWMLLVGAVSFLWLGSLNYVALTAQRIYAGDVRGFDPSTLPYFKPEYRPAAIVVLGGGRVLRADAERGQAEDLRDVSLARLRHAAALARATRLPITVTGGKPDGGEWSEAQLMVRSLTDDFGRPPHFAEDESVDTLGNARGVARMLLPAGTQNIVLVTDAIHMARARIAFSEVGFTVYPAPVPVRMPNPRDPRDWLPTADGLGNTRALLREMGALLWFRASRLVNGALGD